MPFQKTVSYKQAPGVEGDFASTNPMVYAVAGEEQLLAEPLGVTVGRFAWLDYATGLVSNVKPAGASMLVFVHRENNAQIINNDAASMVIKGGFPVSAFVAGEFWARFAAPVTAGQKVYATNANGLLTAGTGDTLTNFVARTSCAAGEIAKISSWGVL